MTKLNRRRFLEAASLLGASVFIGGSLSFGKSLVAAPAKIRGVNLGGWLVLEKWITPSLFAGQSAEDEYSFSQGLGKDKATALLKKHRETWITAEDFKWLAARGINSLRLPVGYWIAEENPPFITGLETMDFTFREAKKNGLSVLLDLHGVPGSQNGWDHSGRQGAIAWPEGGERIAHTLRVIEDLAARCKNYDNLLGIELVNEPRETIALGFLKSYYEDAYRRIRKQLSPDHAAVIFHDSFRPYEWADFMSGSDYRNVILDTHLYQCFSDADRQRDIHSQIEIAVVERKRQLDKMKKGHECIVGEWSLGLPPKSLEGLDNLGRDAAMRAFGAAQLLSYEETRGWYFWTYRTEEGGGWSFRDCVNHGWLPAQFG